MFRAEVESVRVFGDWGLWVSGVKGLGDLGFSDLRFRRTGFGG